MPATIEVAGLHKRYGAVTALDGLDLAVPAGSVFGFLGPNGAGKTTTIKILASLATATSGRATIGGVVVGDGEPNRRGLIGYLDQAPRFNGWMRGRELLELVGRLSGLRGADARARIDAVLDLVGLADAGRRRIGGYSGGMRQRLGIAQAVLAHPPVIMLDEPVSALDPAGRRDMLGVIGALREHSTVLVSSHVLTDVERTCDRVAIIDRGRLVTEAPMAELLERFAQPTYSLRFDPGRTEGLPALEAALRDAPWVTALDMTTDGLRVGVVDDPDVGGWLLRLLVEHRVAVLALDRERPTLEDVFLRLTGRGSDGARA